MAVFWNDWPAWEKAVFILAIAIALTVLAGSAKLAYQHWQTRRSTRQSQRSNDVEKNAETQAPRSRDVDEAHVPFGIRAIEQGVEVEGVWNSANNSPRSSAPPSPRQRSVDAPGPKLDAASAPQPPPLAMPKPVHPQIRLSNTFSLPGEPFCGSISNLLGPDASDQRAINSSSEKLKAPISQLYQPRRSSGLRFSSVDPPSAEPQRLSRESYASDGRRSPVSPRSVHSTPRRESDISRAETYPSQTFHTPPPYPLEDSRTPKLSASEQQHRSFPLVHQMSQTADMGYPVPHSRPSSAESFQSTTMPRVSSPFPFLTASLATRHLQASPIENRLATPVNDHTEQASSPCPSARHSLDCKVKASRTPQDCSVGEGPLLVPAYTPSRTSTMSSTPQRPVDVLATAYRPSQSPGSPTEPTHLFEPGRDRVVRKVNSGFEVLRQGSFATTESSKRAEDSVPSPGSSKTGRRLRKKPGSGV